MLNQALVIAHKEIVESLRDVRSVISSSLYALMGPLVVGLVSMANRPGAAPQEKTAVLAGMMSVFALVAAFVGGMNIAMDTVAGERERPSLVPLLLNPVRRLDIVMGKWLAVSFFAICGLALNLSAFAAVMAIGGMILTENWPRLLLAPALGIFPLALLAAALQLHISTVCRGVKEAQTYLSLIVFFPMLLGMFVVFFPAAARGWFRFVPLIGQQLQLETMMKAGALPALQPAVLGFLTVVLSAAVVVATANRLDRDEIIYGS